MNKRVAVVAGALLLVLAAGLVGIWKYQARSKRNARDDLSVATTKLSDCLLGGPADGNVEEQMHRVQLGARATYTPDDTSRGWPRRCVQYVAAIQSPHRVARARGVVDAQPDFTLVREELALGKLEKATALLRSLSEFTHGEHDPLVPPPPTKVIPLVGKDALHGLDGTSKYGQASELFVRAQDGIRFGVTTDMLSVKHGCEYVAASRSLRCATAPASAEFFPGDLGSPLVYGVWSASPPPVMTLMDGDTPLLSGAEIRAVRTFKDGSLAMVKTDEDSPFFFRQKLVVRKADGTVSSGSFDNTDRLPQRDRYGGGFVVWKERPSSEDFGNDTTDPATIKARAFTVGANATVVGPVPRRLPTVVRTDSVCEADHVFFDMSPVLAVRDDKGGWHILNDEPLTHDTLARRWTSCHKDTFDLLDRNEHKLRAQHCSIAAGCTSASVTIDLPTNILATLSGDDVVVIWSDEDADATYYVRAPIADLPKAKPNVLVDGALAIKQSDIEFGRPETLGSEVFAFGDDVLALMGDATTYAILLKKDGTAMSVSVAP
jgi:hypothetical protein